MICACTANVIYPLNYCFISITTKEINTLSRPSVIKDWSVNTPNSHLAGGITYQDGKLTVPISGRYLVYAQIYYHNKGRVHVRANNRIVTMIQPPEEGNDEAALYTGAVVNLNAGDAISLDAGSHIVTTSKVFMSSFHSYFGVCLA